MKSFLIGMLLVVPFPAFAAVTISEIMYNAPGADAKHEWIEIQNTGADVDLSEWRLFEGDTNHKLKAYRGVSTLASGAYAILADNPEVFLTDYPSYTGTVFDTAFSGGLSNSGERLTLRDGALLNQDSVLYDPTLGAAGDGDTLQKTDTGWHALLASPGKAPPAIPAASATQKTVAVKTAAVTSKPPKSSVQNSSVSAAPAAVPVETQTAAAALSSEKTPSYIWAAIIALVGIITSAAIYFRPRMDGFFKRKEEEPS